MQSRRINVLERRIFVSGLGWNRDEVIVIPSQVQLVAGYVACDSWLGVLGRREKLKVTSRDCAFDSTLHISHPEIGRTLPTVSGGNHERTAFATLDGGKRDKSSSS
jgi:hypothetical protein